VWCAIFEFGVWYPYFFEEDDVTVTVTSDQYCAMLGNFLRPKLDYPFDEHGAENVIPPEMTRKVMEKYRERLNQCIDNEGRYLSDIGFKF
jgi:hypothetical protein